MQSHNNLAILAAAGSHKTQHIVDCVLADTSQRILVTTYTTENMQQLVNRISAGTGVLPKHVTVLTWFTFLLNQCARPYQSAVLGEVGYLRGLNFVGSSATGRGTLEKPSQSATTLIRTRTCSATKCRAFPLRRTG